MRQRRSDEWKTGNGEIDGVGRGGDCVSKRGILSVIMGGDRTGRRKYRGRHRLRDFPSQEAGDRIVAREGRQKRPQKMSRWSYFY